MVMVVMLVMLTMVLSSQAGFPILMKGTKWPMAATVKFSFWRGLEQPSSILFTFCLPILFDACREIQPSICCRLIYLLVFTLFNYHFVTESGTGDGPQLLRYSYIQSSSCPNKPHLFILKSLNSDTRNLVLVGSMESSVESIICCCGNANNDICVMRIGFLRLNNCTRDQKLCFQKIASIN